MARPSKTVSVLSPQALSLLGQLFAKNSNLSVPAGVADAVVEIREWAASQQANESRTAKTAEQADNE